MPALCIGGKHYVAHVIRPQVERIEESVAPSGELILRLALGSVFLIHGWPKLKNPPQFAGGLQQLGVPAPVVTAWGVALLETVGAALLMAGIGTRPLALALAADMAVALAKVRIPKAPFTSGSQSGWDFELMLFAASLALVFTGGGRFAVDRALEDTQGWRFGKVLGRAA